MKIPANPLEGQLQVVRNLAVSSFSILANTGKLRNALADQATDKTTINRVNGHIYKAKGRFDSFRILLQTVDAASHGDAAAALAESFLSYVELIHEDLLAAGIQDAAKDHREACQQVIAATFSEAEFVAQAHDERTFKSSTRLPGLLKPVAPDFAVFFFCVEVARRFASNINVASKSGFAEIVREIHFPPEYQQAGLSILNYFSTVLNDKYPDIPVTVSIQQKLDAVTLKITLPDGTQDTVSRALSDYGLVVTGQMSPKDLVNDDIRAMALQQKLELAQLEVRQVRDLMRLQDQYSTKRIESLETEVKNLYALLGREFTSREKLQEGLLSLSAQLTRDPVSEHVASLIEALSQAIAERNSDRARVVLEDIQESQPTLFSRLNEFFLQATTSGVIGNYAYDWLKVIWPIAPK